MRQVQRIFLNFGENTFTTFFYCLQKQSIDKSKILLASSHNEVLVTADEVRQAIDKLDINKACGQTVCMPST